MSRGPWPMRLVKLFYLAAGAALLAVVLRETDVAEVAALLRRVGPLGLAAVLLVYLVDFLLDTVSWQMTLPSVPLEARWLHRLFKIRMAGEAWNRTVPAAGLGGEPIKLVLLKRAHGIGYREGAASLVLARTINTLALLLFLSVGYVLVLRAEVPASLRVLAGVGLGATAAGILAFWAIQRFRVSSLAGTWLAGFRFARALERGLVHVRAIDESLVHFYTRQRGRFAVALLFALANWITGVAEVWLVTHLLGHPLGLREAWIMESIAQLVRLGSFFIPSSLGTQEGAFFLAGSTLAGSGTLGVAVGLVRRVREVVWIVWGFALGWWLGRGSGDATPVPARD